MYYCFTGYTTDPATLSLLFEYFDGFIGEVNDLTKLATQLSPTTKTGQT